jgi:putative hydrolase of HD superfamily
MKKTPILAMTDKQVLSIAKKLKIAYRLKRTLRYGTSRDHSMHNESVAEHIFALFFLAEYFLPLEKIGRSLNVARLHSILLFHDFGEILDGDISYHLKTAAHEKKERQAAKKVFASLPEPLRNNARKSWEEFEKKKSPEARFAQAIDKVEPAFELLDPISEQSMKRMKFSYNDHIVRKRSVTQDFPVMGRFVEVISNDMLKRKVFWEKE